MKQRVITGAVLCAILVLLIVFSSTVAFPIVLALCGIVAVYEMFSCVGHAKSIIAALPFYLAAGAFPFLIRYLDNRSLLIDIIIAAALLTMLYLFTVVIFSHGKYKIDRIGVIFFSLLYTIVGFSSMAYVRDFVMGGEYLFVFVFIGAWITDTFAYFCGMLFGKGGKHKLIPDVSPKKTVEGSIGGMTFCVIAMVIFGIVIEAMSDYSANLLVFAFAGLLASVVSQIGDLAMSVIKRHYGIKDYGKLFPGHGGILDRFDSIIAVSIVLMVFTRFFDFLH